MAAEDRIDERDLKAIEPLNAATIQFFELCTRLEDAYPQPGGIGGTGTPSRERVRFRANPTLGFPPEEVSQVVLPAGPDDPVEVVVNIFGLHGPSSPLPPDMTERIVFAEDGGALRDFADFFNHRLISLLFRIWKHYRHYERYGEGASDPISTAVAALFGMHGAGAEGDRPERTLLMPYAGTLALYSHSAPIVAGVITHYFGVPCTIEEFVPREIEIPPESLCRLGGENGMLGLSAIAGTSVRDVMGQFRIRLGPLTAAQHRAFLPDQPGFRTLQELIRLSIREPLAWDHALVLAPGEATPARLGEWRLGWDGWLDPDPMAEAVCIVAA